MKSYLVALVLLIIPVMGFAGEEGGYPLDDVHFDPGNKASLQHGAQVFMNYCMGCHSLKYERYERLEKGLGIPEDMVMENLRFDRNAKIGDLMENAMPTVSAKKWFGAAPPDLTLEARARGPQWIYTYLRTFYKDPSRPWGVNNKVFPDVGMPDVLLELQGAQECAPGTKLAENGGVMQDPLTGKDLLFDAEGKPLNPCGRLKITVPGKLTPQEYDKTIYDLANFLNYIAEPMQEQRKHTGVFVLFFLGILFVFAALLNREYWKDVH